MLDEHKMVMLLLAAQTEAIESLKETIDALIRAHQRIEEMYCNDAENEITILRPDRPK